MLINVKDNSNAFNEVFIAADDAFKLNVLISWIVESLKCKIYIPKAPIWMGFIAGYILDFLARLTNKIFLFSLCRLKAMIRDVMYSNRKILYTLSVKNKYGVEQGIKNTVEGYHKSGLLQ